MLITARRLALKGKALEKFELYATYSPTPLSLKKLSVYGQERDIKMSTRFMQTELPVRIANILQELHLLPKKLLETPSASLVSDWYKETFSDLISFENLSLEPRIIDAFLDSLATIRERHNLVVETMAQGVMEMQEAHGVDIVTNNQLQYFLDRFYMMRISIRLLINQHLLVFGEFNNTRRFIGCIDPQCNVVDILKDAYADAKTLCYHHYADAPDMKINLHGDVDGSIQIVYVPSHLYHILFELMKNSMRSVIENGVNKDGDYPAIEAIIINGKQTVSIKLSDRGGGFSHSVLDLLFRYTYTTAGARKSSGITDADSDLAPMAGYGYGLPLSRLYARYLQGDLILAGMEGYGTEAFVFLMRKSAEADELLPVYNRTSARHYAIAGVPIADWMNRRNLLEKV